MPTTCRFDLWLAMKYGIPGSLMIALAHIALGGDRRVTAEILH